MDQSSLIEPLLSSSLVGTLNPFIERPRQETESKDHEFKPKDLFDIPKIEIDKRKEHVKNMSSEHKRPPKSRVPKLMGKDLRAKPQPHRAAKGPHRPVRAARGLHPWVIRVVFLGCFLELWSTLSPFRRLGSSMKNSRNTWHLFH